MKFLLVLLFSSTAFASFFIPNGAVTTAKLANGSVTQVKLAAGVGTVTDLIVGPSQTYTTISSAISAATAGQSIYVQTGTYVENVTVSKQVNILGSGRGVVISGYLTVASGGDYSLIQSLKVTGGITINSGVADVQILEFWNASGQTVADNGTGSFLLGMQE